MTRLNMYREIREMNKNHRYKASAIVLRKLVLKSYYFIYTEDSSFIKNYLNSQLAQL
jgi:hypothetical protein